MANINDKKGVSITAPFKLFSENPVDARTVVENLDELQSIIDNNAAYEGLNVYVKSDRKIYTCRLEENQLIFKNLIVEKENEKIVTEKDPDTIEEMLGAEKSSFWSRQGWIDPNNSLVYNLIDTSKDLVSTSGIATNGTTGYVLSPIIKMDFNNFESYTLNYTYPETRDIRHIILFIDDNDGTADKKHAIYYGSGATTTIIKDAFKTILPEEASENQFYNQNKIIFTLENIRTLNQYCLSDPKSEKSKLVKLGENDKIFYLAFTSSSAATIDGRIDVASKWSFNRFKKGAEHSHIEFNIPNLALTDSKDRFKSNLLDDVIYELADRDDLLNVTDYKTETVIVPKISVDCKLNSTDNFYGSCWDMGISFNQFFENERTEYLISTANIIANSYTSGYLSAPVLILDFSSNESLYYILKSPSLTYYIRHLSIFNKYGNTLAKFIDTAEIRNAFKYALEDDNLDYNSYFVNNGKLTSKILYRLCEYYSNLSSTEKSNPDNNLYYFHFTTRIKVSNTGASTSEDLENAKHAWTLNKIIPESSYEDTSYRLPNLNIENSNGYFESSNLDNAMNQTGYFMKVAAIDNIQDVNETETINIYEEDPDTVGYYVYSGAKYPSFVTYPTNINTYCCTKLLEIDPTKTYNHSFIRHIGLYDQNLNKVGYLENLQKSSMDPAFWSQYPGVKYICISNTNANRQGVFEYTKTKNFITFEMPNLRLSDKNGGGSGSSTNIINLKNVDRVCAIGDSYTESHYTIKDKSWISKVSLFSDFNLENIAVSGDTFRGQLNKIRTGYNRYFSTDSSKKYSWEAMHPSYALLTCRTNDIKYMDEDQFMNDLVGILETTRNMGAIPILATEYHTASNPAINSYYQYLAEKYGGYYIDLESETLEVRGNDYSPFWGGSHPGTRTNELMAHPCIEFFNNEMPRPYQSIKIFRPRTKPSELDELIYGNIYERAEKFKEISISHSALTDSKYYDECTSKHNSVVQSEYLKLMNGVDIEFDKYALIDVIFPATSSSISQIQLKTNELTNVDCYIMDPLAEPYPTPEFCRRFDIPQVLNIGTDVAVGNKYTSSLHDSVQFTVKEIKFDKVESDSGLVDGTLLICTGNRTSTATNGGTLTKVSGTGSETLNFYYSATALSSDYPVGKQPIGHLKKLETFGLVNEADVRRCMQVDKMSFLLVSTGAFSLNNLEVQYTGLPNKSKDTILRNRFIQYSKQKQELTVTNTTDSMPDAITPADNCKPGASKNNNVYLLNSSKPFTYAITGLRDKSRFGPQKIKIRVVARYFPDIFNSSTGTFGEDTSPISLNSFDYVKLKMKLRYSTNADRYVIFEKYVGLHWQYIDFEILSAPLQDTAYLEFFVDDKPLQFSTVIAFIESL